MIEQWKPIEDHVGYYVSNQGRVKSHRGVLKLETIRGGYKRVHIQRTKYLVHRLVLVAFCGPCPDGFQSCHNDGNRSNNSITNLRWGTPKENCHDRLKHGNHPRRAILRSDGTVFQSVCIAAQQTPGAYKGNILQVCNGKRSSCAGFSWSFV